MGQFIKTLSEDFVYFLSRFNRVLDSYNVGLNFGSGSVFHGSISKYVQIRNPAFQEQGDCVPVAGGQRKLQDQALSPKSISPSTDFCNLHRTIWREKYL